MIHRQTGASGVRPARHRHRDHGGRWRIWVVVGLSIATAGFEAGVGGNALAADPPRPAASVARGHALAVKHCSPCHAVGRRDPSPTRANDDTALRDLHKRYPVKMLIDARRTGIVGGHDEMPAFVLGDAGVADLLAYIDSLTPPGGGRYGTKAGAGGAPPVTPNRR